MRIVCAARFRSPILSCESRSIRTCSSKRCKAKLASFKMPRRCRTRRRIAAQRARKGAETSVMRILMVASEAAPFVKTGGLADVLGSLPAALVKRGDEVAVVIPRFRAAAHRRIGENLARNAAQRRAAPVCRGHRSGGPAGRPLSVCRLSRALRPSRHL